MERDASPPAEAAGKNVPINIVMTLQQLCDALVAEARDRVRVKAERDRLEEELRHTRRLLAEKTELCDVLERRLGDVVAELERLKAHDRRVESTLADVGLESQRLHEAVMKGILPANGGPPP